MTTSFDSGPEAFLRNWAPSDDGALFDACRADDVEGLRRLLTRGASPHAIDDAGFRALHVAATAGSTGAVRALLAAGAHVDARSSTPGCFGGIRPLHAAVAAGHAAVVTALLARLAKVDAADDAGFTALHLAAMTGHTRIAKALLVAGADPNREVGDAAPYTLAIRYGHRGTAALLRQCARRGVLRL